jgi:hypothetical protein
MPDHDRRRPLVSHHACFELRDHQTPPEVFGASRRHSRGALVKKAAAGGTLAVGGVLVVVQPSLAGAKPSRKRDRQIFEFLLKLEELQAAFYAQARSQGALDGELRQFADVVGAHEREHVAFLKRALGHRRPTRVRARDFGDTTTDANRFIAAATALEDTVVAAFNGQGPNLTRSGLATATNIVSVEARHAAWIRAIAKEIPAPVANDPAKSERQALGTLTATGFLD